MRSNPPQTATRASVRLLGGLSAKKKCANQQTSQESSNGRITDGQRVLLNRGRLVISCAVDVLHDRALEVEIILMNQKKHDQIVLANQVHGTVLFLEKNQRKTLVK
jgi:hypothetical protein